MMSDKEKVIRLIEEEISVCESVNQCYRTIDLLALRDILAVIKEQDQMYYTLEHDWKMCRELLKEQEAVEPKVIGTNGFGHPIHACGKCGHLITESMNYCHECGKSIEWEGR